MALLMKGATFVFTSTIVDTIRALLTELDTPPIPLSLDWDLVSDKAQPFRLNCDASSSDVGVTLEQYQREGSVRPAVFIIQATLANKQNWTPIECKAGCVVWSFRCLRCYIFGVLKLFTDLKCFQHIRMIRGTTPFTQRWFEYRSAYTSACPITMEMTLLTSTSSP